MKIKSKQVARDLGISEATVSLALNNKPGVNEETKRKILDYIDSLKEEGRRNTEGKSIKVVFYAQERALYDEEKASLFSLSYMEVIRMVKEAGFGMKLVYVSDESEVLEAIETSRQDGTAGIFLYASEMHEREFEPFRNIEIPVMIYDNGFDDISCDCVMIDDRQGVRMAMKHLYGKGHRDIVYFYNTNSINIFEKRRAAYQEFLRENGSDAPEETMLEVGTHIEVIHENVLRFIREQDEMPTAILAENYAIALGAIKALQDNGYRIPEDISIIGIDELPSYALLDFKYTCIKVMHVDKANLAIARLIDKIQNGRKEEIRVLVGNVFVEGQSVADIRKNEQQGRAGNT